MESNQATSKQDTKKPAGPVKRTVLTVVGLVLAGSGSSGIYDELTSDKDVVSTIINVVIVLLGLFLIYKFLIKRS